MNVLLSCSVHQILQLHIPKTNLQVNQLVHQAIIFHYIDNTYVMPLYLWRDDPKIEAATQLIHQTLGINLQDLLINTHKWVEYSISLHDLGIMWETLVSSALVTKYYLLENKPNNGYVPFINIYDISKKGQAYDLLSRLEVNFSSGLQQGTECTVNDLTNPCIYLNMKTHSHPHNFGNQCKLTLASPKGGQITPQLDCKYLLWWSPNYSEDKQTCPIDFRTPNVIKKLESKELGFLRGSGCVTGLAIDLIKFFKRCNQKIKPLEKDMKNDESENSEESAENGENNKKIPHNESHDTIESKSVVKKQTKRGRSQSVPGNLTDNEPNHPTKKPKIEGKKKEEKN